MDRKYLNKVYELLETNRNVIILVNGRMFQNVSREVPYDHILEFLIEEIELGKVDKKRLKEMVKKIIRRRTHGKENYSEE